MVNSKQFEVLVRRLEREAAARPAAYRLRVRLLSLLGYAYIGLVLGVVAAMLLFLAYLLTLHVRGGATIIVKVGWVLLVFAAIVVRALYVRFPPPSHGALERKQAPALFTLVENIARKLRAPRPGRIFITDDFNASVVQVPRLGVLGWYRNDLYLGLPLMAACPREELAAVLAHELGHLSGQHGRFASKIYAARVRWTQLLEHLEARGHAGSVIFRAFLGWYAPFFNAYSFVLARQQEYEADRAAARLLGPAVARCALVRINVVGRQLQDVYWAGVTAKIAEHTTPPANAVSGVVAAARAGDTERWRAWLDQALAVPTGYADTHPSLADRLEALGATAADIEPPAPVTTGQDAARIMLAGTGPRLLRSLDEAWCVRVAPAWRERHEEQRRAVAELATLDRHAEQGPLGRDDAWRRAVLTMQVRGDDEAVPALAAVVEKYPDHVGAHFSLGRILSAKDDDTATAHLERVANDPDLGAAAAGLLQDFYRRRGDAEAAGRWRQSAVKHEHSQELAAEERARVSATDELLPHAVDAAEIDKLRVQLRRQAGLEAAYFARKRVRHFPERPCYVLGVVTSGSWTDDDSEEKTQELVNRLASEVSYPGETLIVVLNVFNRGVRKRIEAVPGSLILKY